MFNKNQRKKEYRNSLIVSLVIILTLFSSLTPFLDDNFLSLGRNNHKLKGNWYNPDFPEFLYEDDVDQMLYNFSAKEECYIIMDIKNTDYTTFTFNETQYEVSYGLNIFPIDFGESFSSYNISVSQEDINNNIFNWIAVEPLYIKSGIINVNLTSTTDISFYAGGMISILMRPNFTYNWLYLEVDNLIINNIYNTTDYPEVDSVLLMEWKYDGTYVQFDLDMEPKQHLMKIKGNGSIDYKIIVNSDWDDDFISDVEEVQKEILYYQLDPIIPNVWGFFQMGDEQTFVDNYINESALFQFHIPESYKGYGYLSINVRSGIITDISVDDDTLTFKDFKISTDYNSHAISQPYGMVSSGIHLVQYKYHPDMITDVSFSLDGRKIFLLHRHEFKDTDADGVKDVKELNSGTNPNAPDTDCDGLIDSLDPSPLTSLTLDKNDLYQFIFPHNALKNTYIKICIAPPENDYSTKDTTRIWMDGYEYGGGLEVSIHPVLRMFGNSSYTMAEIVDIWGKNNESYSITGEFPIYGDAIPDFDNPNGEVILIPGKISKNSFEFDLNYPVGHPAKEDNLIDMRFDIVWVVFSHYANYTEIIHYYDFEDDITIQSFTKKEIQNASYILGSPDSMVENQILWNLVQNDELGEPNDFYVGDDIVEKGSIDYNDLFDHLAEIRETNEISRDENGEINETEVIYISMNFTNYDILNRINIIINIPEPSFEVNYSGNYNSLFSYYSISNVDEKDLNSLELGGDVGESRICSVRSWYNFSENENKNYEERFSIIEYPISMNRLNFTNSEILEITYVCGSEIPLNKFPYSIEDVSYDKIIYINQTVIEKKDSSSSIPELSYNDSDDEYKEIYDERGWEIEASKLVFHEYSPSLARILKQVKSLLENPIRTLAEYVDDLATDVLEQLEDKWETYFSFWSTYNPDFEGQLGIFGIEGNNIWQLLINTKINQPGP
ncbi:MAG: hypothetical protein ACFFG0_50340, partial [Candidatus Thorarchaeota archaeon]